MSAWTKCPHCGLSHSIRADCRCPRCRRAPGEAPTAGFAGPPAPAPVPAQMAPPPLAPAVETLPPLPVAPVAPPAAPGAFVAARPGGVAAAAAAPARSFTSGSGPSAPRSAGAKAQRPWTPVGSAAAIVGVGVGVTASRLLGPAMLVPFVICIVSAIAVGKLAPARAKPFAPAASLLVAHVAWMILGACLVGSFRPVAIDVALMGAGVVWLLAAPGLAPAILLALLEGGAVVVHGLQLSHGVNGAVRSALAMHTILRVLTLVALSLGYRAFRKAADAAASAQVAGVFD